MDGIQKQKTLAVKQTIKLSKYQLALYRWTIGIKSDRMYGALKFSSK
jgi:hypothetical protein